VRLDGQRDLLYHSRRTPSSLTRRAARVVSEGSGSSKTRLTGRNLLGTVIAVTPSDPPESRPSTLGDVLYATRTTILASENTWIGLVQSVTARDQLALHVLYTRMEGLVFTWLMQLVRDPGITEGLMLDVFLDVWRNASTYTPTGSSVIGWIMSQARSRALDRLGIEQPSRPSFGTVVVRQTDMLRPSTSLWLPLARRIAAETGLDPLVPLPAGWTEPEWAEVAPGTFCKLLATDLEQDRVSMLVHLAPGVAYPPHTHAAVEELYLLHGELRIDDRMLYPGGYNRGEPGESDQVVWSRTGCTCVLLTSTRDRLH